MARRRRGHGPRRARPRPAQPSPNPRWKREQRDSRRPRLVSPPIRDCRGDGKDPSPPHGSSSQRPAPRIPAPLAPGSRIAPLADAPASSSRLSSGPPMPGSPRPASTFILRTRLRALFAPTSGRHAGGPILGSLASVRSGPAETQALHLLANPPGLGNDRTRRLLSLHAETLPAAHAHLAAHGRAQRALAGTARPRPSGFSCPKPTLSIRTYLRSGGPR